MEKCSAEEIDPTIDRCICRQSMLGNSRQCPPKLYAPATTRAALSRQISRHPANTKLFCESNIALYSPHGRQKLDAAVSGGRLFLYGVQKQKGVVPLDLTTLPLIRKYIPLSPTSSLRHPLYIFKSTVGFLQTVWFLRANYLVVLHLYQDSRCLPLLQRVSMFPYQHSSFPKVLQMVPHHQQAGSPQSISQHNQHILSS